MVAPSRTTVPSAEGRFEELDGYRGIAVMGIVVFHVFQFCNVDHYLYLGTPAYTVLNSLDAMVPFFFVLTAFLLFEPMARAAIEDTPPISGRGFLAQAGGADPARVLRGRGGGVVHPSAKSAR